MSRVLLVEDDPSYVRGSNSVCADAATTYEQPEPARTDSPRWPSSGPICCCWT